jgi:hypothetical protein
MKRIITILGYVCFCIPFFAQEFSTKFYFETAQGEKVSLEIGYDPTATNGIDVMFDEIDYGSPISPDKFQVFMLKPWDRQFGVPFF